MTKPNDVHKNSSRGGNHKTLLSDLPEILVTDSEITTKMANNDKNPYKKGQVSNRTSLGNPMNHLDHNLANRHRKHRNTLAGTNAKNENINRDSIINSLNNSMMSSIQSSSSHSFIPDNGKTQITNFTPQEIADQLTLLDFKFFCQISSSELDTDLSWTRKDKFVKTPNVVAMTRRFNHTVLFVQREILKCDTSTKERMKMIIFFINVMIELKKDRLRNFHSLVAVISALQSVPIYRLSETWTKLQNYKTSKENKAYYDLFKDLECLTSIDDKRKRLREKIEEMVKPCIPFLGIYLNDIEHIQANSSLINSRFVSKNQSDIRSGGTPGSKSPNIQQAMDQISINSIASSKSSQFTHSSNNSNITQSTNNPPASLSKIRFLIATLQCSNYHHILPNPKIQEYLLSFSYVEELRKVIEDAVFETSRKVEPDLSQSLVINSANRNSKPGSSDGSENLFQSDSKRSTIELGSRSKSGLNNNGYSNNNNSYSNKEKFATLGMSFDLSKNLKKRLKIDEILMSPENQMYRNSIKSRLENNNENMNNQHLNMTQSANYGSTYHHTQQNKIKADLDNFINLPENKNLLNQCKPVRLGSNVSSMSGKSGSSILGHRKSKSMGNYTSILRSKSMSNNKKGGPRKSYCRGGGGGDRMSQISNSRGNLDEPDNRETLMPNSRSHHGVSAINAANLLEINPEDQISTVNHNGHSHSRSSSRMMTNQRYLSTESVLSSTRSSQRSTSSLSSGFIDKNSAIVLQEKINTNLENSAAWQNRPTNTIGNTSKNKNSNYQVQSSSSKIISSNENSSTSIREKSSSSISTYEQAQPTLIPPFSRISYAKNILGTLDTTTNDLLLQPDILFNDLIPGHCQGPISRKIILKDGKPKRFSRWVEYWMHLQIDSGQLLLYERTENKNESSSATKIWFGSKDKDNSDNNSKDGNNSNNPKDNSKHFNRSNYATYPTKHIDLKQRKFDFTKSSATNNKEKVEKSLHQTYSHDSNENPAILADNNNNNSLWYVINLEKNNTFDVCHKENGTLYRFKTERVNLTYKWVGSLVQACQYGS